MTKKIKRTLKYLKEQNRKSFGLFNHITKAWIKRKQILVLSKNKKNTWNTCNLGQSIVTRLRSPAKLNRTRKVL